MNYAPIVENTRMNYTCIHSWSRWVLCYMTGDHQQIMFVDGHVYKLTKKNNHVIFSFVRIPFLGNVRAILAQLPLSL